MRVAFVHDWLVSYRGGEKVLEALLELYPDAPVFTLFYQADSMPPSIRNRQIIVPRWSQPLAPFRKALLPFLPTMIESLPLEHYDLVISTSSCVAKGILPAPHATHLCYIHSPMRYIWDQRSHYLKRIQRLPIVGGMLEALLTFLRIWDVSSSQRVDLFVANSQFVAKRVAKYYGRSAKVIPPPVDVDGFKSLQANLYPNEPYFLIAGAFVSYKRFDLAIEACQLAGKSLVIAGSGPLEEELRRKAHKHRFRFEKSPSKERWSSLFQHAEAFLFPGVEDFGITAIEAMAAGTPVIAYRGGGALDFIIPGETGEFFQEATAESLGQVLKDFDRSRYTKERLLDFSLKFTKEPFLLKIKEEIQRLMERTI